MLTGENGILKRAQEAKEQTEKAQKDEKEKLYEFEDAINEIDTIVLKQGQIAEKTQKNNYIDQYGNKATVPKGFKVSNISTEDDIIEGLVVKDEEDNEFVWIPVGKNIKDKNETIQEVTLGRYVFNTMGEIDSNLTKTNPEDQLKLSSESNHYFTEGKKDEAIGGNTPAKDIEGFINSVQRYGGYYIGRYEARKSETDNKLTENGEDSIYDKITQANAAIQAQNMYREETEFTSDLINSYAWDTAIVFLQKFDDRTDKSTKYSIQTSLNTTNNGGLANQGTNKLTDSSKQDKICNIWDMASNCFEWTTETFSRTDSPCVSRGGSYSYNYTSNRNYSPILNANSGYSFRPLLYIK